MKKTLFTVAVAALALGGIVVIRAATEDKHDRHDHDAATKPADPSAHDEHDHDAHHDHDHAHGHGEEGHADEVKLTPEAIRRHDIRVAPVTRRPLVATFTAPARIAYNAEAMAHVGSAVTGRAVEINVRVGDSVKQGAELIVVESPELGEAQSDYLQKRTAFAVATATVEPARQAAERANKLFEKNQGIAFAEVQRRDADYVAAQGAVQTAQAALDAAENKLRLIGLDDKAIETLAKTKQINPRYVIRAPLSGRVIQRETTLGELVSPETHSLLVIGDLSTVWVIADVSEAKLSDVQIGSPARVRAAHRGALLEGKVSYVAPSLDPNTRSGQVRIEVANENGVLKPGMFARADLAAGAATDAAPVLAVPEESIQTVEGKSCVFVPVEDEENTFTTREVKIGRPVSGMVPIESGLREGERVVVSGTFILKADLGKAGAAHEH